MKKIAVLLLALACGGCFESKGSLYGDAAPVTPLRAGALASRTSDGRTGLERLSRAQDGFYRLANDDRKDHDYGESFLVRFFPLAGLAPRIFVFEAMEPCEGEKKCVPATATRYYGLLRVTPKGAQMINPPCKKGDAVARLPGVKGDEYGCSFTARATLEKALLDLARRNPAADTTYTWR